jgi:two-component system, NarL family, invasion response regulator UvrY
MVNLLIADESALLREGVKKVLKDNPGIAVVAETDNGSNVLRLINKHNIGFLLLDILLPGMNGLDVLKDLRKHYPVLPILMLSTNKEHEYALRCLKLGADGYLQKNCPLHEFTVAIEIIRDGKKYIPLQLAEHLANCMMIESNGTDKHISLSNREFDIMKKLASGMTIKQVSEVLNITASSVTTYKNRLFKKMGFTTNADLVRYSIENSLI